LQPIYGIVFDECFLSKKIITLKKIIYTLTILSTLLLSTVGCKKNQGCTDQNATNFSTSAKKDNGTCTYPTKVEINSIACSTFPTQKTNGDEWDTLGKADPFITLLDKDGNSTYISTPYINPESTVTWDLSPNIIIENIDSPTEFSILMYDEDGTTDQFMGDISIDLNDYTQEGENVTKYPNTINLTSTNFEYSLNVIWK
jgi:hypothetical protein